MLTDLEAAIAPGGFADMTLRNYDEVRRNSPSTACLVATGAQKRGKMQAECPGAGCRERGGGRVRVHPKVDLQREESQSYNEGLCLNEANGGMLSDHV